MSEGSTFGIVPYVKPKATGAIAGVVGAGGNTGAVCWGLMFRFAGDRPPQVSECSSGCVRARACARTCVSLGPGSG